MFTSPLAMNHEQVRGSAEGSGDVARASQGCQEAPQGRHIFHFRTDVVMQRFCVSNGHPQSSTQVHSSDFKLF